jgi:hypothetical protein
MAISTLFRQDCAAAAATSEINNAMKNAANRIPAILVIFYALLSSV